MLENFASIEEKIQHLNSPIFILYGVYSIQYEMRSIREHLKISNNSEQTCKVREHLKISMNGSQLFLSNGVLLILTQRKNL